MCETEPVVTSQLREAQIATFLDAVELEIVPASPPLNGSSQLQGQVARKDL